MALPRTMWRLLLTVGAAIWLVASVITGLTEDTILLPCVVLLGSFLVPVTMVTFALSRPRENNLTVEAVLLGVFGGILGVYVVLRHLAFISDALTHTVFPGITVAFLLDASLYLGAFVAGALSAVLLTVLTRNRRVTP